MAIIDLRPKSLANQLADRELAKRAELEALPLEAERLPMIVCDSCRTDCIIEWKERQLACRETLVLVECACGIELVRMPDYELTRQAIMLSSLPLWGALEGLDVLVDRQLEELARQRQRLAAIARVAESRRRREHPDADPASSPTTVASLDSAISAVAAAVLEPSTVAMHRLVAHLVGHDPGEETASERWSRELREKVRASTERDAERERNQVVVQLDELD